MEQTSQKTDLLLLNNSLTELHIKCIQLAVDLITKTHAKYQFKNYAERELYQEVVNASYKEISYIFKERQYQPELARTMYTQLIEEMTLLQQKLEGMQYITTWNHSNNENNLTK